MPKPVSLTVLENGPLKVSSESLKLRYCGEEVEVEAGKDVFLCRCGESSNAPFCDGSHSKTGFVGSSEAKPKKELRVWEGKTIRTFFNTDICMHAAYCKPLKGLREQELAGDAAAAKKIAEVVESCPSGALTYESTEVEAPPLKSTTSVDIEIMEGGELRLQCDFEINEPLPERQTGSRATLCRCGLSQSKPWCDGRHKKREGFR